ncbi:hypothetical protein [Shewanella sp. Isolate11]|uniref:hypothetical protein n=1 Tax=Shewanella sp. Isolate11 TaxID=2908530 RepID=UPI001EFC80A4|nr:hypothetical protein [Shewanella sp. Isolate11]MCG9697234.1 hypothetical protein [Shewanella sp. Isolate11]
MILENKKWLNSKGFSDTEIDSIVQYCHKYPIGEKEYNEQFRRLKKASKHLSDGLTQLKAIANSYPLLINDIELILSQLENNCDKNCLMVGAGLDMEKTCETKSELLNKLEQIKQGLDLKSNPSKTVLVGNLDEPPMELKITTGKGELISRLHYTWLSKGNEVTISETSDFITFLAVIFDDKMENASKWKSTFDRVCIKLFK